MIDSPTPATERPKAVPFVGKAKRALPSRARNRKWFKRIIRRTVEIMATGMTMVDAWRKASKEILERKRRLQLQRTAVNGAALESAQAKKLLGRER